MARHRFPGDTHILASGGPASNAGFTLWSDSVGGTQFTDILASDGVSPATLITDATGNRPYLYGPDGIEFMYVDTGTSIRYPVAADDQERVVLDESFLSSVNGQIASLQAQLGQLQQQVANLGSGGGGTGGGGGVALTSYNSQVRTLADYPATFPPSAHTQAASTISGLAAVATTGSYNDLSGKPVIPSTPTAAAVGAVANIGGTVPGIYARTATQGTPTVADLIAAGVPDGALITVDES